MFNFFKQKWNYPSFEYLKNFDRKDYYFLRVAEWDWLNKNSITITDPYNPRLFTLDPWPQLIFLNATGQKTISEFIYFMADEYSGKIPDELDRTIIQEIETLLTYRIVEFSEIRKKINPQFDVAKSKRN